MALKCSVLHTNKLEVQYDKNLIGEPAGIQARLHSHDPALHSGAAFEILIPLRMADLIDQGIDLGDMAAVWKFGIAILIFAALQLLTGVLSAHIAAKTSVGFSANLRQDMYDNVQTFAFSNIDKFSTASIVTRLTTDVTNIQNAYQMLLRMAVRGPVMLVFAMIVSFRINTTVALIFLAVIPIMALLLLLIICKVGPIFTRVFHTYDELNNVVQENVRGIRVVKSFNQEDHEIKKIQRHFSEYL